MNAAIVQELKVHRCMELEALCFPSDIRCLSELVCCDFVSVVGELSKLAIPIEHIMEKCFDISTVNMCVITKMVCHSEVSKRFFLLFQLLVFFKNVLSNWGFPWRRTSSGS